MCGLGKILLGRYSPFREQRSAFESYISAQNLLLYESLGLYASRTIKGHWRGVKLFRPIPFSREVKDGMDSWLVVDCLVRVKINPTSFTLGEWRSVDEIYFHPSSSPYWESGDFHPLWVWGVHFYYKSNGNLKYKSNRPYRFIRIYLLDGLCGIYSFMLSP